MSEVNVSINIVDWAGPELAYVIATQKQIVAIALRRTVFHYRKKLMQYLENKSTSKRMLDAEGKSRVMAATVGRPNLRAKHIHPKATHWKGQKGKFFKTIRFYKSGNITGTNIGNSYTFGFVDDRTRYEARYKGKVLDRASKTAAKYGKALVEGQFYNKKTDSYDKTVTRDVMKYMESIGLGMAEAKYNTQLQYKADPAINTFLDANAGNIRMTFIHNFEVEFARKVARERVRTGPQIYNSRNQQRKNDLINRIVARGHTWGLTGSNSRALTGAQARAIGL